MKNLFNSEFVKKQNLGHQRETFTVGELIAFLQNYPVDMPTCVTWEGRYFPFGPLMVESNSDYPLNGTFLVFDVNS